MNCPQHTADRNCSSLQQVQLSLWQNCSMVPLPIVLQCPASKPLASSYHMKWKEIPIMCFYKEVQHWINNWPKEKNRLVSQCKISTQNYYNHCSSNYIQFIQLTLHVTTTLMLHCIYTRQHSRSTTTDKNWTLYSTNWWLQRLSDWQDRANGNLLITNAVDYFIPHEMP